MDLVKLIKDKIKVFSQTEHFAGMESVISHIEIAERHLDQGKKGDDYLFNDVIYRTNQAFEGSLKEAYNVLANKSSDGKSPNEIEKYLESNNLLKERVLSLFPIIGKSGEINRHMIINYIFQNKRPSLPS